MQYFIQHCTLLQRNCCFGRLKGVFLEQLVSRVQNEFWSMLWHFVSVGFFKIIWLNKDKFHHTIPTHLFLNCMMFCRLTSCDITWYCSQKYFSPVIKRRKVLIRNRRMSRWTKLQILFQFHLINYRRRKILLVPAFANADADLCVPEYNPQKGLLWTNCVCRMDREPVYFSKSGFLNKYKAPYFWRQLPNNLYNTAVLRSHISHLFFFLLLLISLFCKHSFYPCRIYLYPAVGQ